MKPAMPKNSGPMMWKNLSPVLSECLCQHIPRQIRVRTEHDGKTIHLALIKAIIAATPHGGAHSRRVVVREYPRVAVKAEKSEFSLGVSED